MKYNQKIILIFLVMIVVLFSYSAFSITPPYLSSKGVTQNTAPDGSYPPTACSMRIVKSFIADDPFLEIDDYETFVPEEYKESKSHSAERIAEAGHLNQALSGICEISCLSITENYNDLVSECSKQGNYYVVFESPSRMEDMLKRSFNVNDISRYTKTEQDIYTDSDGNMLLCDDFSLSESETQHVGRIACKLPDYSPEKYASRCAGVIDPDLSAAGVLAKKSQVFLENAPDNACDTCRCCGNDYENSEDDGMIFNQKLCFPEETTDSIDYRWIPANENALTIYKINKPSGVDDSGNVLGYISYNAVSNYEDWFVCMPGDASIVAAAPENSKKLSVNDFLPMPSTSSLSGSGLGESDTSGSGSSGGSSSGSSGGLLTPYAVAITGYAVNVGGTETTGSIEERYRSECSKSDQPECCDVDGDGFITGTDYRQCNDADIIGVEDCDDNPFDDSGSDIARNKYPGAYDPCSSGDVYIDNGCDGSICTSDPADYTNFVNDEQHLSSMFVCDQHDDDGTFVQCCGADLDYCGDRNNARKQQLRIAGSMSTTLKDFDNLNTGQIKTRMGENVVPVGGLYISNLMNSGSSISASNNQVLKLKLKSLYDDYPRHIISEDGEYYEIKMNIKDLDAQISDFSRYDYLEFFYKTKTNYVLNLRINTKVQDNSNSNSDAEVNGNDQRISNSHLTLDVKDYVVNSPGLDKWMHIVIPINKGERSIKSIFPEFSLTNVESITFLSKISDVTASIYRGVKDKQDNDGVIYDNIIYIDRISLKFDESKKNSKDKNMYCVSNKFSDDEQKRFWINDLDVNQKDEKGLFVGDFACSDTPSYSWTGTQCCGNEQTLDNNEYYADTNGGCWLGNPVKEGERLSNIKFKLDFDVNDILGQQQGIDQTYLCKKDECFYPVTNARIGEDGNKKYTIYPYELGFNSYLVEGTTENAIGEDSAKYAESEEDYAMVRVENIPLQITYGTDAKFHLCGDPVVNDDLNNPSELSNDIISEEHCTIVGDFFCSYKNDPIMASGWSNEQFYSQSLSKFILASDRDTSMSIPELDPDNGFDFYIRKIFFPDSKINIGDEIGSEQVSASGVDAETDNFVVVDTSYEDGCCPDNFCFDGFTCVDGLSGKSFGKTIFDESTSSFALKDWAPDDERLNELDFDQFVCAFDVETKKSDWTKVYQKEMWDNLSRGYCLSQNKCWYNNQLTNEEECVNTGFWEKDHYCDEGDWISRTKLLAERLVNVAGEEDNFALFCDTYENVLNEYQYTLENAPNFDILSFLSYSGSVNNFCVLTYPTDEQDKIFMGVTLNKDYDGGVDPVLEKFMQITPEQEQGNCENVQFDDEYGGCLDETTDKHLFLNKKTSSLIYTRTKGLSSLPLSEKTFLGIIEQPVMKVINLIRRIFGLYTIKDKDYELSLLDSVNDFNTIYFAKNSGRYVLGHKEELESSDSGLLSIKFENFNADVCSKLYGNDEYQGIDCIVIIDKSSNEKPSYLVTTMEPSNFNIWHDGTAKLRLHDSDPDGSGSVVANIKSPVKIGDESNVPDFEVNENLKLEASLDNEENIQSYYWDLDADPESDLIYGRLYGRTDIINILDTYGENAHGYHTIKLITIGYQGNSEDDEKQICINDCSENPSECDADNDGVPNGCDLDDDNDGVCDYNDNNGNGHDFGEYGVPEGGCEISSVSENGDDNCIFEPNGPNDAENQIDTNGDGYGDVCDGDSDGDKVLNIYDDFDDDPGASKDFDNDGKPNELHEDWVSNTDLNEFDEEDMETPLIVDDDDDNDGVLDDSESNFCRLWPDCDQDHLLDGKNKKVSKADYDASENYQKWVNDYDIAYQIVGEEYQFFGEASYGTSKLNQDTDGDGIPDINEIMPNDNEPDPDELDFLIDPKVNTNYIYSGIITRPHVKDSDNDCLADGDEITGDIDINEDDYVNSNNYKTHPMKKDSEKDNSNKFVGDGMFDGWEIYFGLNPTMDDSLTDTDGDGLLNKDEFVCFETYSSGCNFDLGCKPNDPDSDNDGICDGSNAVENVCIAGPDSNPVQPNGPEINPSSVTPAQGTTIYYEDSSLINGQVLITIELDKPANCWISKNKLDVTNLDNVDNKPGAKEMIYGGSEKKKKSYFELEEKYTDTNENIAYINCRDKSSDSSDELGTQMDEVFELKLYLDTKKINVILGSPQGEVNNLVVDINIKSNRVGECKIDVAGVDDDKTINYDGVGLTSMAIDASDSTKHSVSVDFTNVIKPNIANCLTKPMSAVCAYSANLDYSSCDLIVDNDNAENQEAKRNLCKNIITMVNKMKGTDDSCSGSAGEFGQLCSKLGPNSVYGELTSQCNSQSDPAVKLSCLGFVNFAWAIKEGLSGNYQTYCDQAKVEPSQCISGACFDYTEICNGAVNENVNICYNNYCSYVLGSYYYLVKCEDTVNNVIMDNTKAYSIRFSESVDMSQISVS